MNNDFFRRNGVLGAAVAVVWLAVAGSAGAQQAAPVPAEAAPEEVLATPTRYEAGDLSVLSVQSRPEGARVFVDGEERGTTPVYVRDLDDGPHEVILYLDGFGAYRQRVDGPGGRIFVDLGAEHGVGLGLVTVSSIPPDARVEVDGRRVGLTPLEIPLEAGNHTLRLVREGYKDAEQSVAVEPGGRREVSVVLDPREGAILVIASPAGGRVLVDGRDVGAADEPVRVDGVPPGLHAVEVRRQGYRPWRKQDVAVSSGRTVTVLAALLPERDYSWVRLFTDPPGARVFLDGEELGVAGPDGLGFRASKGAHTLRLALDPTERPGYLVLESTVRFEQDEEDFRDRPLRLPPVDEDFVTGRTLLDRGQLEQALTFLGRVPPDHPSYGEARLLVLDVLVRLGRIAEIPGELGRLLERPDQVNNPVLNTAMGYWCLVAAQRGTPEAAAAFLARGLDALERAVRTPELFPPEVRDALHLKALYYAGITSELLYHAAGQARYLQKGVQAWDVFFARLESSPDALEPEWIERAKRHRRNLEFLAKKLAG